MITTVTNSPAWGDMLVTPNPIIQVIELFGCWHMRRVRWFRADDRSLHLIKLERLEDWKIKALRAAQLIFLPFTVLCMLLKTFLRLKEPIHNLKGREVVIPTKEFLTNSSLLSPEAILIIGCTGSGKSQVIKPITASLPEEYTLLDADELMANIPEYNYEADRGLDQAADNNHKAGSKLRDLQFGRLLKLRRCMILETTSNKDVLTKWVIKPLRDKGYRIKLIYVDTRLELCVQRAAKRSRKVPVQFIESAHNDAKIGFAAVKDLCDEWEHYDNNEKIPNLVSKGYSGA